MSSEAVIRPARTDELAAVLRLWQESGVTPPSVTDSIEGLTRLMSAPGSVFLVAFIDGLLVGSVIGGHEHRWAMDFWESLRDLGYEYDPRFARYISDRS